MIYLFLIPFLLIFNCNSDTTQQSFTLEGKWKDIKSDNIYEKDRKEILFDIQRFGKQYTGRVISLDNALDSNGEIRQCNKCLEEPGSRMLLGFPIIKQLKKVENENKFVGKIYDIQQRKWFDLSITPLTENQIQVRIYAGIPLFGKSFKWERGDNYYKGLISKSPSSIKNKKGIYALTLGDIDAKTEKEVFLRCETIPPFQKERKVYFFTMEGKKSAEGTFLDFIDGQARIQINTKNPNFSQQPSLSVIFFDY